MPRVLQTRPGIDTRQIDAVPPKDGERPRQRAGIVMLDGERNQAPVGLVAGVLRGAALRRLRRRPPHGVRRCAARPVDDEEARGVALDALDAGGQDVQAEELGGGGAADGRAGPAGIARGDLRCFGCAARVDALGVRQRRCQECRALRPGLWVAVERCYSGGAVCVPCAFSAER